MFSEGALLVAGLFAEASDGDEIEMVEVTARDDLWEGLRDRVSPSLEIRFVTPPPGGVSVMDQEFEGIEGLREGWRQWLRPWEQFRIQTGEVIDAGDGRILLLAQAVGVMRETPALLPLLIAAFGRVEDGQIAAIAFYLNQDQARRDAGLA